MLKEVLKFSHKTPVAAVGVAAAGAGLAGCNLDPAARMSQTPAMKKKISKKYGK